MLTAYFERNFDYFVQLPEESPESLPYELFITSDENSKAGRPAEKIYLTPECFKEMGMLSKSEQGRQIRKYFLQCEGIAKQSLLVIPQLIERLEDQNRIIEEHGRAIALLQSLLPLSSNAAPPGWNEDVWQSLPPQDKRHFRYIFRRRGFRPSHQGKGEPLALPAVTIEQVKQKQLAEVQQHRREVSHEEKEKLEAAKQEALRKFWLQEEDVAF